MIRLSDARESDLTSSTAGLGQHSLGSSLLFCQNVFQVNFRCRKEWTVKNNWCQFKEVILQHFLDIILGAIKLDRNIRMLLYRVIMHQLRMKCADPLSQPPSLLWEDVQMCSQFH